MYTRLNLRPIFGLLLISSLAGLMRLVTIATARWSLLPVDYAKVLIQPTLSLTAVVIPSLLVAAFALLCAHLLQMRKQIWYEGYLIKLRRERAEALVADSQEESDWAFSNLARDPDPLVIPPRRYVSVVWRATAALILIITVVLVITKVSFEHEFTIVEVSVAAMGCLALGFSEELLFRGVLLSLARRVGWSEVSSALATTGLYVFWFLGNVDYFMAADLWFLDIGRAILTGLAFYALRRTFGRLWVPIAIHALWDFTVFVL